jgi:putative thioredoxin
MTAASKVIDVTDDSFQKAVLDESKKRPVVVDFWAPWCGPCRVLGPTIEKVAAELGGKVTLAKLNTDENPKVAMKYGIQSIPAVKAFRDGAVASEFIGAVPEPQVRDFFSKLLPSEAETAAAAGARMAAEGDSEGAEKKFQAALDEDPRNVEALVGMATLLVERGQPEEARPFIDKAIPDRRAKALGHRIFLTGFAQKHADEDIEGEAKANDGDPRARYRWGVMLAANGKYEAALDELLDSVRLDKQFADGAARKAILAVFDILGLDSDLTKEYQRTLSQVLF